METQLPGWTLGELTEMVGGTLHGDPDIRIVRPVPAGNEDPQGITFAESAAFLEKTAGTTVGAVIVSPELIGSDRPTIVVDSPRMAFGLILHLSQRPLPLASGVHATAVLHPDCWVEPSASVGPYCVIERGARIGPNVKLFPFCYIGENCHVSEACVLYPQVVLYRDVTLGERCVVHSGAIVGADGFGFVWDGQRRIKVPQVGAVEFAANVEIGANACIDRATCGETTIGEGTKLDNLVQIGHNVRIGAHTVIAGLSGISGSADIGSQVTMGGQVAVMDHAKVADGASLAGRTGVMRDIEAAGEYFGTPATPAKEGLRSLALHQRLPELLKRIKELEAAVEALQDRS